MKQNLSEAGGFTLIELLVVISIIGMISSMVFVSANTARAKARYARVIADSKQIVSAAALYYDKYGVYPAGVGPTSWAPTTETFPAAFDEFVSIKQPPCPNWQYTVSQLPDGSAAIMIRKVIQGQIIATLFTYTCMQGSCSTLSALIELKEFPGKMFTCSEV